MTQEELPVDDEDNGGIEASDLVSVARRDVAPASDLDQRLAHLSVAVEMLKSRLPSATVTEADGVLARASSRLRLSADHTVVALAGATGSGKSSTFNALTGLDVAAVGVRRPTTSWAMACLWGSDDAAELLEWLGIPQRHQVIRDSLLDRGVVEPLQGMVLLDLPDHDSTEVAHRLEVDRLMHLVDVIVWVMDPQKYADAAIHDALLQPNVRHASMMVAVVNHIDEVPEDGRDRLYRDARRLLDGDGLSTVPLIATSATVGTGLDELRSELAARISRKAATRTRISADTDVLAKRLLDEIGQPPTLQGLPHARSEIAQQLAASLPAGEDGIQIAPLQPEVVRNVIRSQARVVADGSIPMVVEAVASAAVSASEGLDVEIKRVVDSQPTEVERSIGSRGGIRAFLAVIAVAAVVWLVIAAVKHVPNVPAAVAVTAVALIGLLATLLVPRRRPPRQPLGQDVEGVIGQALDRTVMPAMQAEIETYAKVAAEVRSALAGP